MPKFSEVEKNFLRKKTLSEGERLFSTFGIRKVSIDDIVKAVGIAKGSFYAFYPSKEHLYMDIVGRLQAQMWNEMESFLEDNCQLPPVDMVKSCFLQMIETAQKHPLIRQVDDETISYLTRKLPVEIMKAHTSDDSHELVRLEKYGVEFKCGREVAAKVLQMLAISFFTFSQDNDADKKEVMEIILNGVLKEIVSEKND